MPCNTIQRSRVSFELRAENIDLLAEALRVQGFAVQQNEETLRFSDANVVGSFVNGKLSLSGEKSAVSRFDRNAVKRGYSHQIVKAAAKRMGWELKADKQNANKISVKRRF